MMNQKVVIYIILSAILLYLYYKRGGVILFAAFVVVVVGTLFTGASSSEGMKGKGGKTDKECAKMGFTETKIDKKNMIGSLKKINDKFKKALLKYGTFENDEFKPKEEMNAILKPLLEDPEASSKFDKEKTENKNLFSYVITVMALLMNTYTKSDSGEMTFKVFGEQRTVKKLLSDFAKKQDGTNTYKHAISSGGSLLKMLNEVKTLDIMKNGDKEMKELWNFIICAVKHTIVIIKNIDKTYSDGGANDDGEDGEGGDDEEEKPKKKKKKATKKKKKSEDDEGDDEGDD